MHTPKYFKQERLSTCSLAIVRSVLFEHGIEISEDALRNEVKKDYGSHFKNIWNPTIAKLACQHGVNVEIYARWRLFKNNVYTKAYEAYKKDPEHFDVNLYEDQKDNESLPEPVKISYREMFKAVEAGCGYAYGGLTQQLIETELSQDRLILATIKRDKLYPDKKVGGYHSILLYGYEGGQVYYHDPYHGKALHVDVDFLLKATPRVAACIVFE